MKFIKSYNQYKIFEAAKSIDDLIADKSIKLHIVETRDPEKVEIILYNPSKQEDEKIVGAIRLVKNDGTGKNPYGSYSVNKSAINLDYYKGYGPTLYDIALQYCGDKGLRPDRSTSLAAKNIWKYYFDNRKDIVKKPIDNFRSPLTPQEEDDGKLSSPFSKSDAGQYPKEIEDSSYINHVYYYSGEKQYEKLVQELDEGSEELVKAMNDLFIKHIQ